MFPEQDKNNSQNDTDEKKYEIQGYNNFQDFMKVLHFHYILFF